MKSWQPLAALLGLMILVTGCSGDGDTGQAPPPAKTYTEAEIAAMPPQAQQRVRDAQQYAKGAAETNKPSGK